MSALASALTEAMTTSVHDLVVLDQETREWSRHPWPEVHARAENVAARALDDDAGAIGLVGEPTVELIAAIQGGWLAGAAVAILPGPVRGADPAQWAQATLTRFDGIGVSAVFSHGDHLERLRDVAAPLTLHDVTAVAHDRRSTTFIAPGRAADVAVLQGTAGSTGIPRTAQLSPEAVLANLRGLAARAGRNRPTSAAPGCRCITTWG